MRLAIPLLLIILLGQVSFVFGQEESNSSDSSNDCAHKISVSITNLANLDNNRISIVKDAIFSQKSLVQDNNTYFMGWNGALKSAGSYYSLELSNSSNTDITILLTTSYDPQYNGRTVVQHLFGHLTYARVIIYTADKIPPVALANLIRHEMGHALGLGHTTVQSSIMYPFLPFTPKYISDNDLTTFITGNENSLYVTSTCT